MLDIKTRQTYLKSLGFYKGKIDGIEGPQTTAAYLALQEKYFTRKRDLDGKYGPNTEILLINACRVMAQTKNFKLEEFKCQCKGNCTGYPHLLDVQLLKNLQSIRDKYGPTTITSGLRCVVHNSSVGGSSTSRHKYGQAADIKNAMSASLKGRKKIMAYFKTLPGYRYTYCNANGNHPNMGTAVHIDVK